MGRRLEAETNYQWHGDPAGTADEGTSRVQTGSARFAQDSSRPALGIMILPFLTNESQRVKYGGGSALCPESRRRRQFVHVILLRKVGSE